MTKTMKNIPSSDSSSLPASSLLWTPSSTAVQASPLSAFAQKAKARFNLEDDLQDYHTLHRWSVDSMSDFWNLLWDDSQVIGEKGERTINTYQHIKDARFFPDSQLNFAENLLGHNNEAREDQAAIIFRREDGLRQEMSWRELRADVSRLQQAMRAEGIVAGDRVAGIMPNAPMAIIAMLATTSLGAIWSSCSPDFGEQAVVDRFGQIEPRLLFVCDGYFYNGKTINLSERIENITQRLNVSKTIVMPFIECIEEDALSLSNIITLDEFIGDITAQPLVYTRVAFSDPLYIMFSSGTTGVPKCIVHSVGGTLLQHSKEHRLHCGLQAGDRLFYFTTCGWMMWNWLVTALACEATVMLYDGSPFYPDGRVLLDYAAQEKVTVFGTSAKYIDALRNASLSPIASHDFSSLRIIASTGSPLTVENYHYVYTHIKQDVQLASISGGTDIVSCFVGGIPSRPVYAGEIQGAMLGMDVAVWDDEGKGVIGEKGELVCTAPFPSMPIGFWSDVSGEKYHQAYYSRFDNVWCQGDFAERTEHDGFIIHGRSDATLNPGGVRIGTAEIYNQVEALTEIEEALCVGQSWDNDTRVILFVRLADGVVLDAALQKTIRHHIRTGASPRHVPAVIVEVSDIPRTKSGKIAELAVRDIIHGRAIKNSGALANPECLALYENLPELKSEAP